jgi:hypothetical protein
MSTSDRTPTVVLVHGAFVDASSRNGVIAELKAAGLDVVAPPNLLRGVGVDAAYLTGFVAALGRPAVLAGHSYAGAVISQTGSDAGNVAGLVYIAAYAPEAGETLDGPDAAGGNRGLDRSRPAGPGRRCLWPPGRRRDLAPAPRGGQLHLDHAGSTSLIPPHRTARQAAAGMSARAICAMDFQDEGGRG